MIIQNDDNYKLVNFDNIIEIFLHPLGNESCAVKYIDINNSECTLGIYSTYEKGQEILEELIAFYIRNENKNKVFRMPIE